MLIINKIEVCPKLLSFLKLFSVLVLSDFSKYLRRKTLQNIILLLLYYFATLSYCYYLIDFLQMNHLLIFSMTTHMWDTCWKVIFICKFQTEGYVSTIETVHSFFAWNYEHLVASCSYQDKYFHVQTKK